MPDHAHMKTAAGGKVGKTAGYHHGDLRSALLDAARCLIETKGPEGFTMKDASRMAGVSVAAPYRHFDDRDSFIYALVEEEFSTLGAKMAAIRDREAPGSPEAIHAMGMTYLYHAIERPGMFQLMFASTKTQTLSETKGERISEGDKCFGTLVSVVEAFVARHGGDAGDVMGLVAQLWTIVHGTASLCIHEKLDYMIPNADIEDIVHEAEYNLLSGYLKRRGLSPRGDGIKALSPVSHAQPVATTDEH